MILPKDLKKMKTAAIEGDVKYLTQYYNEIKSKKEKPKTISYLVNFPDDEEDDEYNTGNIFHLAVKKENDKFIKEAIELLTLEEKRLLLLQKVENNEWNPLHTAADVGNLKIVKMLVSMCKSLQTLTPFPAVDDSQPRAWLQTDDEGRAPCFVALDSGNEQCGLELMKLDTEKVSMMTCTDKTGLLFNAVIYGFDEVAIKILKATNIKFNSSGYEGDTPLHRITGCEDEKGIQICKLLLQRDPVLIQVKNDYGGSILHSWADEYELWPFECLLDSKYVKNSVFAELVASPNNKESNPLHRLVSHKQRPDESLTQVAKLLIETYRKEESKLEDRKTPWLMKNKRGHTPFSLAIEHRYEQFAMYMLEVDENVLDHCKGNALLKAVKKDCPLVVAKILEILKTDTNKWNHLLINEKDETTILHLAPLLNKDRTFFKRLLADHSYLLEKKDKGDNNVLHYWLREGGVWQLEDLLKSKWRKDIIKFIDQTNKEENNPFHVAAASNHYKESHEVVQLLVKAYKEEKQNKLPSDLSKLPWFCRNRESEGPLQLAITNENDTLALFILLLHDQEKPITKLLDFYKPNQILLLAVKNNCRQVTEAILKRLEGLRWENHLIDSSYKKSVMHLASSCKDEAFGKFILEKAEKWMYKDEKIITKKDKYDTSPLSEACEKGATWFIQAFWKKYHEEYDAEPLAWIKACEKGKVSTMKTIIEHNPGKFRYVCVKNQVSPLHHIKLNTIWEYEEFLKIPLMNKELLNIQNSEGDTPLHKAIANGDKLLTQTLLGMKDIKSDIKGKKDTEDEDWEKKRKWIRLRYFFRNLFTLDNESWDIEDERKKTAKELLQVYCHDVEQDEEDRKEWKTVCRSVGFDPNLTTSYVEGQTNLLDVRNSLFVVAALLATITFTAGFTLPGGLDQNNGQSMLAKRTSFFVFLISNTFAMCSSMLVLICLVYSMVTSTEKSNQSLKLIDRSLQILLGAFYATVLAFVTGVYLVISTKVYWLAMVVIVMCGLIIISGNRKILFKVLLIPSVKKKQQVIQNDEENPSAGGDDDEESPIQNTEASESPAQQSSAESEEEESEGDWDEEEANEEDSDDEDPHEESTDEEDTMNEEDSIRN